MRLGGALTSGLERLVKDTPTIDEIRELAAQLQGQIVRTPVLRCAAIEEHLGGDIEVHAKLEFLQQTGTFKARGALATLASLDEKQLAAGVTAVSAGNHAIATAYAARCMKTSAKVVMMRSANPLRVQRCKQYGAEVVFADDAHSAFAAAEEIQRAENRFLVHPFEGPHVVRGTATVGLEIAEQVPHADAVIVSIGGGGLCAGISSAVKRVNPRITVFGVEPRGADSMHQSFASGKPESLERVETIADSLGAPFAAPFTFSLCQEYVDELVYVSDEQLMQWMGWFFREMKMALEPACVASAAALCDALADRMGGKTVVLVLCGSNIDWASFQRLAEL